MNGRPRRRSLVAVGIGVFFLLYGSASMADDVRPVSILIKELASGEYDVKWSVPKVIPPQSMPSPRLPDGSRPIGKATFVDRPSVWLTRQVFHCPNGVAGQRLGIDFPLYNIGLSTLIKVELLSGDRYAHLLAPGQDSWRVPEAGGGGFTRRLEDARHLLASGVRHFFGGWVHLVFLLMVCLVGDAKVRVRLVTAFLAGQAAAVAVGALSGIKLDAPLAEIGVALATVLLARQALLPTDDRRQLNILAACAGITHGLGVHALFSMTRQADGAGVLEQLVFVLGMDFALLTAVAAVSGLGWIIQRIPRERLGIPRLVRAAVYAAAGVSLAFAAAAVVDGADTPTTRTVTRLQLPGLASSTGMTVPVSKRVASRAPDAAIQSFVAVEAFEARHEILVRLKDVAPLIGAGAGPELVVEDQPLVKEKIREFVLSRASLDIDGKIGEPVSQRVDFVTLDEKGVLPRPEPVSELVETAWVGVSAIYLTQTVPRELALSWNFPEAVSEIPATVTDPEFSVSASLSARDPELRWTNDLTEDPVPTVSAISVEPALQTVPLWSLVPFAAALFFAGAALRRRRRTLSLALARVMLALAILLGPFGNVALALPWSANAVPGVGETKRIMAGILSNVYRALEFREESAVFDRLSLSVKGETLSEVYLDHRRVLEMEERGGARARVEAVEIVEVDAIARERSGGFSAQTAWTVGGTVTHFGHRHFRQNRYSARVVVVPDRDIWKLQSIEILNEQRVR